MQSTVDNRLVVVGRVGIAGFSLCLWSFVATCRAAVVVDQSHIPTAEGLAGYDRGDYLSQTFTVGIAGVLDHVDVLMRKSPGTGNFHFDIRPTISGIPVESDALALATGEVDAALFPLFPPEDTFAWITLDVSSAHIAVLPGERLAIVARSLAGERSFSWYGAPTPGYALGATFLRLAGRSWEPWPDLSPLPHHAYAFVTYVNVPEPTSFMLALFSAFVVTACRRWRPQ